MGCILNACITERQDNDLCRIQKVQYDPQTMSTEEQIEFIRHVGMTYEPNCELQRDGQVWTGYMLRRQRSYKPGSSLPGSKGVEYWIAIHVMTGLVGSAEVHTDINTRRDRWTILVNLTVTSLTDERDNLMVQFEDGKSYVSDDSAEIVRLQHAPHVRALFSWMKSYKCLMSIRTAVDVIFNPVVFM